MNSVLLMREKINPSQRHRGHREKTEENINQYRAGFHTNAIMLRLNVKKLA